MLDNTIVEQLFKDKIKWKVLSYLEDITIHLRDAGYLVSIGVFCPILNSSGVGYTHVMLYNCDNNVISALYHQVHCDSRSLLHGYENHCNKLYYSVDIIPLDDEYKIFYVEEATKILNKIKVKYQPSTLVRSYLKVSFLI